MDARCEPRSTGDRQPLSHHDTNDLIRNEQIPAQRTFQGYHRAMARGWESKSVEEQVEQRTSEVSAKPPKTGQDAIDANLATRKLERDALELQRERILDERTSSPIRRKALEAALADIEAKLSAY